ncbi:MAG: PEGA domain-containing protein [Bacteroidales bacterium]|nr:PEGA domain-containing protein [Bacteroidales bacterium]
MKSLRMISALAVLMLALPFRMAAQTPASDELGGLQWAVFKVSPENSILTVDGTDTYPIRNGVLQVMLTAGAQEGACESPYYDSDCGEFELTAEKRSDISISLIPTFGYVTVNSTQKKADIILDGEVIGKGRAGSGRVMAGVHSLMLVKDVTCLYRTTFSLERGERRTIDITSYDLKAIPMSVILAESGMTASADNMEEEGTGSGWGGVNVHSNLAGASVVINGLESGTAPCIIKPLRAGQPCRVTLKYPGYKDVTKMVRIKGGTVTDIEIRMKKRRK